MTLREWIHFFNVDRHMWICVDRQTSDGKIEKYSALSPSSYIASTLGWCEIVQAKVTEKGNLWILIK